MSDPPDYGPVSERGPSSDSSRVEHILCAAIWVDTGKAAPPRRSHAYPRTGLVFAGWRHADCFVALQAWRDALLAWERDEIDPAQLRGRGQGFITSTGRFVDREEAAGIAFQAGQTPTRLRSLTSEDLY